MTEVKRIKCGTVNCYLLIKDRNAVLVDTGRKEHLERVRFECSNYDLRLIVLTHPHIDHAENAAVLSKQFECPVAMNGKDTEVLYNFMAQPLSADTISGKALYRASLKGLTNDKVQDFSNKIFIEEGDTLSDYGVDATVVALPGHTYGSIGLDVEGRDFIVGDALMNFLKPTEALIWHDKAEMRKTVEKIKNIGHRMIWFGHGNPVDSSKIARL